MRKCDGLGSGGGDLGAQWERHIRATRMEFGPSPLAHHKDVLETFVANVGITALGKGHLTYYAPRDQAGQQVCVEEVVRPADVDKEVGPGDRGYDASLVFGDCAARRRCSWPGRSGSQGHRKG